MVLNVRAHDAFCMGRTAAVAPPQVIRVLDTCSARDFGGRAGLSRKEQNYMILIPAKDPPICGNPHVAVFSRLAARSRH